MASQKGERQRTTLVWSKVGLSSQFFLVLDIGISSFNCAASLPSRAVGACGMDHEAVLQQLDELDANDLPVDPLSESDIDSSDIRRSLVITRGCSRRRNAWWRT